MSLINIKNLTFGYDGSYENVFENVNLQLDTSWKLGLTGRNGRGKTTLMKLLMGELEYKGKITSTADFEYFPYYPDSNELVINIIWELAPGAEEWEMRRELSMLDADSDLLYRPFSTLSNGEQTKVLIVGMFMRENSFLLIDEPTNHLDTHARRVLAEYLGRKSGYILISHDRDFLDACVDHILVISKCSIEVSKGNFSTYDENRRRQEQFETVQNERLKREISQLEKAAKQAASHSEKIASTKIGIDPIKTEKSLTRRDSVSKRAAKLMNRAKNMEAHIERDIEEKSGLLKNVEKNLPLKISPLKYHSSRLIACRNLSLSYGDSLIFGNVSFTLDSGERIALRGKNGCGKSSLIKLIIGEITDYSGEIFMGSRLKISYVCQSADSLCGSLDDYISEYGIDGALFRAILCKLNFSSELFFRRIESYSQGQKKKVMLARSLSEQAHLYIWDEPLNYIDIMSRMQIEELLKNSDAAMIFVEHDSHFCDTIATKQIFMDNGAV